MKGRAFAQGRFHPDPAAVHLHDLFGYGESQTGAPLCFSVGAVHLVEMLKGAIQHRGFALVDVFSPCVTYNKDNTYQWFNPRVKVLEEEGHNPADFNKAIERGYQWGDAIPIGLFWKRADLPSLEDQEPVLHDGNGPLAFRKLGIPKEHADALIKELL